jgi:hypothetical protein
VAACRCSRTLSLEIIMETMSIRLPSSKFFAGKESTSSMVDDHYSMEHSLVISSSGKGTIKFYVQPLHLDSGLPATHSSWLPSLHRPGHAVHTEQTHLHRRGMCIRHLTFDSAATRNDNEYVSATPPLRPRATQFAFGESSFHPRGESCPDSCLDSLKYGGSDGVAPTRASTRHRVRC